jgi:hypothetical protein
MFGLAAGVQHCLGACFLWVCMVVAGEAWRGSWLLLGFDLACSALTPMPHGHAHRHTMAACTCHMGPKATDSCWPSLAPHAPWCHAHLACHHSKSATDAARGNHLKARGAQCTSLQPVDTALRLWSPVSPSCLSHLPPNLAHDLPETGPLQPPSSQGPKGRFVRLIRASCRPRREVAPGHRVCPISLRECKDMASQSWGTMVGVMHVSWAG